MKIKIAGGLLTASAREIKAGGGSKKKHLWTVCSRISLALSVLSFPSLSKDTISYFLVHLNLQKSELIFMKNEYPDILISIFSLQYLSFKSKIISKNDMILKVQG